MPTTRERWVTTSTLPQPPSYDAMLEFFGIPPYSADKLDDNIARKRRDWHAKASSGNPRGREKAKQVVDLIHRVSAAVKRGANEDVGGGSVAEDIPAEVFATLEELWRIVSEYVFSDDYDTALSAARAGVSRWGMEAGPAAVLAWVVAIGFESSQLVHPNLLQEGLSAAETAVRGEPAEARNWESATTLLLAADRAGDAVAATDSAARALPQLTARLQLHRARGLVRLDRPEEAAVAAASAVHQARSDPYANAAVRSQATVLLVEWVATKLLPIESTRELARYIELVETAAWCADGVPEAEDMVRDHRMWATNAGQRVFTGSWMLRSFLAVCTGFLSLPIHNWTRSTPAWRVFQRGLTQQGTDTPFWIVASPQYVQRAHRMRIVTNIDQL